MYQVPTTAPTLPRWYWLAMAGIAILTAACAMLLAWLLDGSVAQAGKGTLMMVPAGAIHVFGIAIRYRRTSATRAPTDTELRFSKLIIIATMLVFDVMMLILALTDAQPGPTITEGTSRMFGIFLMIAGPSLVGEWIVLMLRRRARTS